MVGSGTPLATQSTTAPDVLVNWSCLGGSSVKCRSWARCRRRCGFRDTRTRCWAWFGTPVDVVAATTRKKIHIIYGKICVRHTPSRTIHFTHHKHNKNKQHRLITNLSKQELLQEQHIFFTRSPRWPPISKEQQHHRPQPALPFPLTLTFPGAAVNNDSPLPLPRPTHTPAREGVKGSTTLVS